MYKILIFSVFLSATLAFSAHSDNPALASLFEKTKIEFCVDNPWDCNSLGHVVGLRLDSFFLEFFKSLEVSLISEGFDRIDLEYCTHNLSNCYFYESSVTDDSFFGNLSRNYSKRQITTLNQAEFEVTTTYPKDEFWYDALKPYSSNRGIVLFKYLSKTEFKTHCTFIRKSGTKFSQAMQTLLVEKGSKNISLEDFLDAQRLTDIGVEYRMYLGQPHNFNLNSLSTLPAECIVFDLQKRKNMSAVKIAQSMLTMDYSSFIMNLESRPYTLDQ